MRDRRRGSGFRLLAGIGALAAVVAGSVGFAVGDVLASPSSPAATAAERSGRGAMDYHWSWSLAPGKTIEIEGVNGEIRAAGTTGKDVVVDAHKRARRSNPDDVTIEVLEHADGITLCVHYPDSWGSHNTCAPHGESHMSTHNNDVAVDFDVKVPSGVRFMGRTVNGGIVARGLEAAAEAHTVNGGIELSTRGWARASTVNGSVRVALGSATWSDALSFKTVNGSVTVEVPEDIGAHVHARTVNGGIQTDFPVTVQGRLVGHMLEGTLGKGGGDLELETVNGSIRLIRAGSQ